MVFARMRIAAAALGAAFLLSTATVALAQSVNPQGGTRPPNTDAEANKRDGQRKLDEFAEAAKLLGGPAAHPECVWIGRNVVSLMWRDDLDTAFRHLDIYDRFGCPAGHIQATFRCLVRQGNFDQKLPAETLRGRVHGCWINPSDAPAEPASAAAPSGTTNR
ncbi:MAG TPA: beta-1-3, beta-1-6-glucan biosynthesis protein [Xanthobacteraceae bacterium]|nr:beta-1-3, beta-1-6-glucan biosynthesis protein [Xanthobacteraceae bacterium]